ncbi:MAG: calcium/sodium antiporter [Armatimonadota bacterium]|nr:calcium/sodium antiporter [Armatimonadota bacterium]MDR5697384.1 calcium/sodium antiporter [Armatimonadota bacterium]
MTTAALFVAGLVALVAGAEALVRGASRLAGAVGVSPLVIGLTVVAYGTSAPELAISLQAALTGKAGLSVGNIVGSNIFNILFILGLSALITPLRVDQQLVWLDVPVMIGVSVVLFVMGLDGVVGRWEGAVLVAGVVAYTAFQIRASRRESEHVREEYEKEFGHPPPAVPATWLRNGLLCAAGLALLTVGSRWLVDGAVAIARSVGVSELVIGLTIVAAGTSLPEVATSIVAALRKERDIAVGNLVGSNIFNVLSVAGATALVAPAGLAIPEGALRFDMPVMVAVAVACLPIFARGHRIDRWEGGLFFGYYVAYALYVVLEAAEHDALPVFSAVMTAFVLPITVITLVVVGVRHVRRNQR